MSSASLDVNAANNTATDPTNIRLTNLATSTKTVVDLNGGDANPGDILRYTVTLTESAGFVSPNARVTDDVPANVDTFTVTALPAGAVNNSTGAGTGANGSGFLDISNITVPANGSVTVVFEVRIAPGTPIGSTIDNTASIDNPNGTDANPAAPQLVVSQSQIPSTGVKPLYVYGAATTQLSRTPAPTPQTSVTLNGNNVQQTWTLAPALQTGISLPAGNVPVQLWISRSVNIPTSRTAVVTLLASGVGTLGSQTQTLSGLPTGNPALRTFTIPIPATNLPAGATLQLRVQNTTGNANRSITIFPIDPVSLARSNIGFTSNTVINVNSVLTYSTAFPGTTLAGTFAPGATVFMRAVVSDPFGSFDISAARLTLLNPSAGTVLNNVAMTQVADSGAATRTYELSFALPGNAPPGAWTVRSSDLQSAQAYIYTYIYMHAH